MSVRFLEDLSVDGNVGIGTTSPSSTLTINQTNDNGIKLIGYDDRDDASANIYIDSGGHLKINNTNGSASGYIIIEAENYLNLRANSFVYFTSNVRVYDSNAFGFGSGNDLIIQHDGSHSYISQSGTGNLYIQQNTNDADMVFQCDDGSGGTSIYMMLDGSESRISTKVNNRFDDNVKLELGTSGDLDLLHDGSNSYIHHNGAGSLFMKADTGDINIINYTNDRDIVLSSDNGSGGTTAYLTLDGSVGYMIASKAIRALDSVNFQLGASADFTMQHNGVNTILQNYTGNLEITQEADDGDIVFKSDDGSGGTTPYLTLDGSTTHSYFSNPGNVGIGTSSPDTLLEVSKSTGAAVRITSTATGNGADVTLGSLEYYGNDASVPGAGVKSSIVAKTEASLGDDSNLIFSTSDGTTNNIERLRINSSGDVGIGNTSPETLLHLTTAMSSSPTTQLYLDVDGTNTNGGGGEIIFNTSASAGSPTSYNAKITGTRVSGGTGGDSQLGFWTTLVSSSQNPQERMTITKEGNVGIGTTSPDSLLHVSADVLSGGATNTGTITIEGRPAGYLGDDIATIDFHNTGVKYADIRMERGNAGNDSQLVFSTSDTGTLNDALIINEVGNVGIGTTSPGEKLDVAGNAIINGDLTVTSGTSGDATLIISADTDNSEEGDSPRLWFKADGDITQGAIQHNDNTFDFISNVSANGGFKFLTGTTNNTGTTDPSTGATERVSIDSAGMTISGSIQLGHASDTTIARASAGKVTIEGAPIQTTQMSMSHHNFYFNTSSTTIDYFVPFNSLTESSNPTTTNYYGRMVAPYDGRIVKAVINTTAAIGTACSAQFWVATSSGTFAPSPAETVSNVNLNTANTAATATFSGTSTAEFSEGDIVGLSIQKSGTTSTAYIQVTIVWEYTV